MMSLHFALNSELTGAIAKRLPHAKNQLSAPGSFFNHFVTDIYIYVYILTIKTRLIYIYIYIQARFACFRCAACRHCVSADLPSGRLGILAGLSFVYGYINEIRTVPEI